MVLVYLIALALGGFAYWIGFDAWAAIGFVLVFLLAMYVMKRWKRDRG